MNETAFCYEPATLEEIHPGYIQAFLVGLYSATSLLSLLGNCIVLIVQLYGKVESRKNIRKYLINLAVSDLIIGVLCVPFTYHSFMSRSWRFSHWLCPTAQFVQLLSVFVTSMTLTIIGIERYIFALHPLSRLQSQWSQSYGHVLLLCTWLLGALYAFIPFQYTSIREFTQSGVTHYECSYLDNGLTTDQRRFFMASNFLLTFLIPGFTMGFSYISIIRKLLWDQKQILSSMSAFNSMVYQKDANTAAESVTIEVVPQNLSRVNRRKLSHIKSRLKTIKIMLVVIIAYCTCWMPIKIFQFLFEFDQIIFCSRGEFYFYIYTYIGCHWLAMSSSFINPFIFSIYSKSFRNDFRRIVDSCFE